MDGRTTVDVEAAAELGARLLADLDDPGAGFSPTARAIVTSALESFATRGFHATTLKHISAASGLSTAALYVHFTSKEEVLAEVSLRGHRAALELVSAATTIEPPAQAIATAAYTLSRWHAEQRLLARVGQYERSALRDGAAERVTILRRETEQVLRLSIEKALDGPDHDETRVVTTAILSLAIDVARWFRPDGPWTPDGVGRRYAGLAARLIGTDVSG